MFSREPTTVSANIMLNNVSEDYLPSPNPGSDTRQASKLQVDTGTTQGSTSSINLDVAKELEDEVYDASTERDDVSSRSTKGRTLSAISEKNLTSGSNISELQLNDAQPPQLAPAMASP